MSASLFNNQPSSEHSHGTGEGVFAWGFGCELNWHGHARRQFRALAEICKNQSRLQNSNSVTNFSSLMGKIEASAPDFGKVFLRETTLPKSGREHASAKLPIKCLVAYSRAPCKTGLLKVVVGGLGLQRGRCKSVKSDHSWGSADFGRGFSFGCRWFWRQEWVQAARRNNWSTVSTTTPNMR